MKNRNRNRTMWKRAAVYAVASFLCMCITGCTRRTPEIIIEETSDAADADDVSFQISDESLQTQDVPPVVKEPQTVFVHVCGAVVTEGVYELPADSRVVHAIQAAGGVRTDADASVVNQAQPVSDGMRIRIPTYEEAQTLRSEEDTVSVSLQETGASIDSRVNINTASAEELKTLNGIGDSYAQAIIAYRTEHGAFTKIEDIMKVRGIKDKLFSRIKEQIRI